MGDLEKRDEIRRLAALVPERWRNCALVNNGIQAAVHSGLMGEEALAKALEIASLSYERLLSDAAKLVSLSCPDVRVHLD